jgi:hypothetical protein
MYIEVSWVENQQSCTELFEFPIEKSEMTHFVQRLDGKRECTAVALRAVHDMNRKQFHMFNFRQKSKTPNLKQM